MAQTPTKEEPLPFAPASSLTNTVAIGDLYKRGSKVASWHKRKFVLHANFMSYYAGEELKNRFDISNCTVREITTAEAGSPAARYAFTLTAPNGTSLTACASSARNRTMWMNLIREQVEDYRDDNQRYLRDLSEKIFGKGLVQKGGFGVFKTTYRLLYTNIPRLLLVDVKNKVVVEDIPFPQREVISFKKLDDARFEVNFPSVSKTAYKFKCIDPSTPDYWRDLFAKSDTYTYYIEPNEESKPKLININNDDTSEGDSEKSPDEGGSGGGAGQYGLETSAAMETLALTDSTMASPETSGLLSAGGMEGMMERENDELLTAEIVEEVFDKEVALQRLEEAISNIRSLVQLLSTKIETINSNIEGGGHATLTAEDLEDQRYAMQMLNTSIESLAHNMETVVRFNIETGVANMQSLREAVLYTADILEHIQMTTEIPEDDGDSLTVIFEVNNEIYSWNKQWEEAIRLKNELAAAREAEGGASGESSANPNSTPSSPTSDGSKGGSVDSATKRKSVTTQAASEFNSQTLSQLIKSKLKAAESPMVMKANKPLPVTWSKDLLRKVQAKEKIDRENGMDEETILATREKRQHEAEKELWEAYSVKDRINNWEKRASTKRDASGPKPLLPQNFHSNIEKLKNDKRRSVVVGRGGGAGHTPSTKEEVSSSSTPASPASASS